MEQYIYGKNTVLEALKGDKEVYKLYLITNDARVFDIETGKEFVD